MTHKTYSEKSNIKRRVAIALFIALSIASLMGAIGIGKSLYLNFKQRNNYSTPEVCVIIKALPRV